MLNYLEYRSQALQSLSLLKNKDKNFESKEDVEKWVKDNYIKNLYKENIDFRDKLHRRNMQIKDLKAQLAQKIQDSGDWANRAIKKDKHEVGLLQQIKDLKQQQRNEQLNKMFNCVKYRICKDFKGEIV